LAKTARSMAASHTGLYCFIIFPQVIEWTRVFPRGKQVLAHSRRYQKENAP
jgi:hypothetical protein